MASSTATTAARTPPPALIRAVRLASVRMATSGAWKFARVLGALIAFWLTIAVLYLALEGHGDEVHAVIARGATWTAWLGGTVMAWWCAGDRAAVDQTDGIEDMARTYGIAPPTLAWGRVLAATTRVTALVAFSSLPIALASLAGAPTLRDGLFRLVALLPLGAFALGVGLVAGALACACGWLSPHRGRAWLTAIVLVPWTLDGLLGPSRVQVASIPGALGFLADLITRVGGGT
ncbi:MAG: hypothetical protein ACOC1F_00490 [Myxococcota bacterium]